MPCLSPEGAEITNLYHFACWNTAFSLSLAKAVSQLPIRHRTFNVLCAIWFLWPDNPFHRYVFERRRRERVVNISSGVWVDEHQLHAGLQIVGVCRGAESQVFIC